MTNKKVEIIKRNLFTNDMNWQARAEQNNGLAKELREEIALEKITDKREIVEILDYLDDHNL